MSQLHVYSEIGKLKKVLLHEPGEELNNLTPKYLEELLFDDIPWLPLAKREHQAFAKAFIDNGIEVVYLVDLVCEALYNDKIKEEFINTFIEDLNIPSRTTNKLLYDYLMSFKDTRSLVLKCIAGIKESELPKKENLNLSDYILHSIFVSNPMPNLYFTRDPFAVINDGVCINRMFSDTRRRETIFGDFIFRYHKDYKDTRKFYNRNDKFNIEGGDICILSDKTLAIGVSQRTSSYAIEKLARTLFYDEVTNYEEILAFSIPRERTFMHLDTIFSQVDSDKFTIHKGCYEEMVVYEIKKNDPINRSLKVTKLDDKLEYILEKYLGRKITLIPCGGNDTITSDREQWSDGSNCICISPGVVIAYERNDITNSILEANGIKVIRIPSSELSRGRGGPRCMSMHLVRED